MGRLLLPFSGGIDSPAIDHALTIAERSRHTLVVVSLLGVGADGWEAPLAGFIEQSVDFLELIQNRARRRRIPLVVSELYSHDIAVSIQHLAREMDCVAVLLFTRDDRAVMLTNSEVQQLLSNEHVAHFRVRLKVRQSIRNSIKNWWSTFRDPEDVQYATSMDDIYHLVEELAIGDDSTLITLCARTDYE